MQSKGSAAQCAVRSARDFISKSKELSQEIAEHAKFIQRQIEKPLLDLARSGNKIEKIYDVEKIKVAHIFSKKHIQAGILNIAKNEQDIMKEFIRVIKKADSLGVLKEGSTNILTHLNNIPVEVRIFVRSSELMGFDAFVGHSKRGQINGIRI